MDRRQIVGAVLALAGCGPEPPHRFAPTEDSRGWRELPTTPQVERSLPENCDNVGRLTAPKSSLAFSQHLSGLGSYHLSPDGRTMMVRDYRTLVFIPLDGAPVRSFPLEGPSFGVMDSDGTLAWSADSRSVWLLKGETARSGFSTGPLACARRFVSGRIEVSPQLQAAPGRLDQVRWVDGTGLGVAQFDLRGGYYRPEQSDANPGLGVIEAATGRVRSHVSVRSDLLAPWGSPAGSIYCAVLGSIRLADGRVRSLVRAGSHGEGGRSRQGGLLLWTEGEPAAALPEKALEGATVFVDGGRKLLIRVPLAATGVIFEHRPSPPPTPVSGHYAGLYDLEAGRWVWRVSGRSTTRSEGGGVAVSASGRKALIGLPASCDGRAVYGLIDVRTGRVRQHLLAVSNSSSSLGFNKERPWIASGGGLDLYG